MKRLLLIIIVAFIAASCSSFFMGCTTSSSLPPYYVAFTVDGERYVWEFGLTEFESNTFGSKLEENPDDTHFIALPTEEEWSGGLQNYITIAFEGAAVGTYPIQNISYTVDGTHHTLVNGSITITNYEDVGGVIEGTFSVEVTDGDTTITIENGEFKVMRVADNTYWT